MGWGSPKDLVKALESKELECAKDAQELEWAGDAQKDEMGQGSLEAMEWAKKAQK